MELTGVTVEPVYTLGEKMAKAGLNTVICMSIVFTVLIFISLIINCFNIFPYLEAKKQEKKALEREDKDLVVTQIEQREEQQLTDDAELVAVIAAAMVAAGVVVATLFTVFAVNKFVKMRSNKIYMY